MDKINLIHGETILQKLNYRVNSTNIYMKREDLIDFALGGNKVRLFEYIAADVMKKKAEKIITFGSVHSNHVRVAAITANYLGISCDLIILYDTNDYEPRTPNLDIIKYCKKVNVVYCKTGDATSFIDEYLDQQKNKGINYYWIPGGGHLPLAVYGYMDVAAEIEKQIGNVSIDAVFLPCGTGTTMAGIIAGSSNNYPVFGVTVARSVERCKRVISKILSNHGLINVTEETINVLPCDIGYGKNSLDAIEMVAELIRSDGIILDPIYNAKSFLTMKQYIVERSDLKNIVYINTGGTPNLFQ